MTRSTITWWNCFNLFDDKDDPNHRDFIRERHEYLRDIQELASVLGTLESPPRIIGLGEVENRAVMNELCDEIRWKYQRDYHIDEYIESRDVRGIDVSVIHEPHPDLQVIDIEARYPADPAAVRPAIIMHATLHDAAIRLCFIHGKSRRSGPSHPRDRTPGSRVRFAYAELMRDLCAESVSDGINFMALGDFNDHPDSPSMIIGANAALGRENNPQTDRLYNLTPEAKAPGTHQHDDTWAYLDQVLVSGNLLTGNDGLRCPQAPHIHTDPPLLWHGKPNRWYSDHLPISIMVEASGAG